MAGIYRRGKTWWGRVQRDGKDHRQSLETRSESVARKRLETWVRDLANSGWGEKPRLTLNEVLAAFTKDHLPTIRPGSSKRYGSSIDWLDERLGDRPLTEIGRAAMSDFETWRRTMGASAPTIRRDLACLSSVFSFAIEREWIETNPVGAYLKQRARRGLTENPPRTRYLSHDEEARLIAAASPDCAAAIRFAIYTGLRQQEQFGLTWDLVRLEKREILIPKAMAKGKRDRHVVMLQPAVEALERFPKHIASRFVFRHNSGHRFLTMDTALHGAARRAGIKDIRWHDLRRTHGCRLLQDYGFSLSMVRDQLGHSTVATTERSYAFLEVDARHQLAAGRTNVGT